MMPKEKSRLKFSQNRDSKMSVFGFGQISVV